VIPRRHDVNAQPEQVIANVPGDPKPGGRVFDIRNHDVDLVMVNESSQATLYRITAGLANDVAYKKDAHAQGIIA